jgi:RHS repeat-associated protein
VSKTFSDGTPAISYSYAANGQVASMTDGTGTWMYSYDAGNRVTQIAAPSGLFTYGYDAAGNLVSKMVPDSPAQTMTIDDAGQLASLSIGAEQVSFAYDAVGNQVGTSFANGVSETRSFDRGSRLLSITTAGPGGPIGAMVYTRDENGNPTGVDVSGPSGIIVGESTRNTFDTANRLRKTCYTTTTCTGANQTLWTYNTVGSRLTEKRGTQAVNTYTYDMADQLTSIAGPDAKSFSYNPNGDMLTAGSESFTYNTARQTTSATVAGQTTSYTYDGLGNRATTTTGTTVTSNVWDTEGGLPVLVSERVGGVSQRAYQYVGSTPIRTSSNGVAGWYHGDHVGSITNITGQTGSIEATYRYSPYGTTRSETVTPAFTSNPLKYTGQQQNPSGGYNLRARQYQPTLGSFTQTDPMPYGPGTAFESAYVYAGNRPQVMVDPGGMRFTNASTFGPTIGIPGTNKCINYRPGNGDGCTKKKQPKAPKARVCKIDGDWKQPLLEDCKAAIHDYQQQDVVKTLNDAEKAKLAAKGIEYFFWFKDARDCYAKNQPLACSKLLADAAERFVGSNAAALSPVAMLLVEFNVAVTSSTVNGSFGNVGTAFVDGTVFRDFGGGVQTAESPAGSVRLMQGTYTKRLVDCGDGL